MTVCTEDEAKKQFRLVVMILRFLAGRRVRVGANDLLVRDLMIQGRELEPRAEVLRSVVWWSSCPISCHVWLSLSGRASLERSLPVRLVFQSGSCLLCRSGRAPAVCSKHTSLHRLPYSSPPHQRQRHSHFHSHSLPALSSTSSVIVHAGLYPLSYPSSFSFGF